MSNENLLRLVNVGKSFQMKNETLQILKNINITVKQGEMNIIMGPSGSGKSTLLNLIGLLDKPTDGEIYLNSCQTNNLIEKERSKLRAETIGFVFQDFNLFPNLNTLENVTLPLLIHKNISKKEREDRARELLDIVGLSHRINHMPKSLSGGEKQRVSIARSLATNPKLLLADEPTGNVDEENEINIIELFQKLSLSGVGLIVVTHNPIYKAYADRFYKMRSGTLEEVKDNNEAK
ncbi:ABC transporter ATP-binding protein [Niallia sp. 01092]|uniref:ABC transporter ATP-binding protein n=1 Tax=unclassified Niallia TaxID=2837522 RepID=UPI003FCF236E